MHLETRKKEPKMGNCYTCNNEMERVSLSVCSRCMIEQYCSRECQVAAWPKHKEDCDEYVRISTNNKQNKQQDIGTSSLTK